MNDIQLILPFHLRNLAQITSEITVSVPEPATLAAVLDELESRYPMLRGTIRDQQTRQRRAFIRFFACEQDLSLTSPNEPLPAAVQSGQEPLMVIGALAGG